MNKIVVTDYFDELSRLNDVRAPLKPGKIYLAIAELGLDIESEGVTIGSVQFIEHTIPEPKMELRTRPSYEAHNCNCCHCDLKVDDTYTLTINPGLLFCGLEGELSGEYIVFTSRDNVSYAANSVVNLVSPVIFYEPSRATPWFTNTALSNSNHVNDILGSRKPIACPPGYIDRIKYKDALLGFVWQ